MPKNMLRIFALFSVVIRKFGTFSRGYTPYAYVPRRLHHWVEPFILNTSIKVDKLDEKTFHPSIFFCLSKLRLQNRKHVFSRPQHPVALPGHKGHTIPQSRSFHLLDCAGEKKHLQINKIFHLLLLFFHEERQENMIVQVRNLLLSGIYTWHVCM